MIRLYLIHTVLIAVVTAILSTQWTPAHIHLSNSHDHDGVHHQHVSQTHSHQSIDAPPTHGLIYSAEASHHSDKLSIIELDYEFHSQKVGKWDKPDTSIDAIVVWQHPLSISEASIWYKYRENTLVSLSASINRTRAPPYLI